MLAAIDALHARARNSAPLHRLVIVSRLLLALAFIPTGLVKLLGRRFTVLTLDNPVGAFFEAMYQTGIYWNFLGLGQVLAGVLILVPMTATLGAICFLPILLNIVVLTWALPFGGTGYITVAMLLANLFLLGWDYDRWKAIVVAPPAPRPGRRAVALPRVERAGYVVGGIAAMVVLLATRGLAPTGAATAMAFVALAASGLVLAGWVLAARDPSGGAATGVEAETSRSADPQSAARLTGPNDRSRMSH